MLITNYYFHCNESWYEENCDSFHNDRCPVCNCEIEPKNSIEQINEVYPHLLENKKYE